MSRHLYCPSAIGLLIGPFWVSNQTDLPAAGLLSFFYVSTQETFGDSPEDRVGWQVAFFDPSMQLKPTEFPASLPQKARFAPLSQ